jgi:PqqD family protein of HPr-rel-A system
MADPLYRAAPPAALRVEPLGELTLIFDRRSMQTHVVAPPMPQILEAMGDDRCDARAIAERLSVAFDIERAGDAASIIAERLDELAALGLVAAA